MMDEKNLGRDESTGDHFGRLPLSLLLDGRVSDGAKIFYAALALYSLPHDGIVGTSQKALGSILSIELRSTVRYIRELVATGYLESQGSKNRKRLIIRSPISTDFHPAVWWQQNELDSTPMACYTSENLSETKMSHKDKIVSLRGTKLSHSVGSSPYSSCLKKRVLESKRRDTKSKTLKKSERGRRTAVKLNSQTDWDFESVKAEASARSEAARKKKLAAKERRQVSGHGRVSREHQFESRPVTGWSVKDFAGYFAQRYQAAYPNEKPLLSVLVPAKAMGQLQTLRSRLANPHRQPDEQLADANAQMKALFDHVFDNLDRIMSGLDLSGRINIGILAGYWATLLGDMKGSKPIKPKGRAAIIETTDDDVDTGFTSTAEGWS